MQKTLHNIVLGGLFLIPIIPFIVFNDLFFPFITGKAFVFRIIIELAFGAWIILTLTDISYRPKRSWLLYTFAIFIAVITIADVFGVNFYRSFWSNFERMDGLITFLHLFAYFLMLGTIFTTEKIWSRFWNTTLVANTILCLFYALPQILGSAKINQSGDRVDASLGNAAYLAVYLLVHIFIALFLAFRSRNISARWFYGISIALQIFIMYRTQTRGPLLGLLGGLFLVTIIIAIFEKERKNIRKIAVGTLVILALFVAGFFLAKNTQFVKNSPTLHRFAEISFSSSFLQSQGRYYIWPMAITGFKEHPILGWGQENFIYVFNKNYDPKMYGQEPWFDRTHNVVLDWLISAGLLGLLSYLSMFFALLYYIWRGKGTTFSIVDKSILTGLVAGYFFQNLFIFDNLTSYLLFVMLVSYVYSLRTSYDAKIVAPKIVVSQGTPEKVLASVVLLVFLYVLYLVNVRPIQANISLYKAVAPEADGQYDYVKDIASFKKAISYNTFASNEARLHFMLLSQKLATPETPEDIRNTSFIGASEEMKKQIAENKTPDARDYLFLGMIYGRYGVSDQALFYLNQAHNLSPKKQSIYFEISNIYFAQGKMDEALGFAKEALDLAPSYKEARVMYSVLAIINKKLDLAKELLSEVDQNTYFFDERILKAYADAKQFDIVFLILKKRSESDPTNAQFLLSLAAGYLALGDRQGAIYTVQKYIALDPVKYKSQGEYYMSEIRAGRNP